MRVVRKTLAYFFPFAFPEDSSESSCDLLDSPLVHRFSLWYDVPLPHCDHEEIDQVGFGGEVVDDVRVAKSVASIG